MGEGENLEGAGVKHLYRGAWEREHLFGHVVNAEGDDVVSLTTRQAKQGTMRRTCCVVMLKALIVLVHLFSRGSIKITLPEVATLRKEIKQHFR